MTAGPAFRALDPGDVPGGMYHLLNAAIAPRPIAWVATLASDGTVNLAPHSYTTILSPNPPIVGFVSVGPKDTLRNVLGSGEFVYHVAGEELAERLNRTAADFPPDVSEVVWAGLTTVPSERVRTPRVVEAPIAFEATLVDAIPIAGTRNTLVMGEVVRVHVAERIMDGERIDPARLRPLGRLAGSQFSHLGELFSLPRPTYAGLLQEAAEPMAPVANAAPQPKSEREPSREGSLSATGNDLTASGQTVAESGAGS